MSWGWGMRNGRNGGINSFVCIIGEVEGGETAVSPPPNEHSNYSSLSHPNLAVSKINQVCIITQLK